MVLLEAGRLPHKNYINIWHLPELHGIEADEKQVRIGALTTYSEIQAHPVLRNEFPMLCQAARETGGLAIQNRGTLGGNIVNGSPAADSPPALLAYDAELELSSRDGKRRVLYQNFHLDYKQMDLHADELLTHISLPRNSMSLQHYYRKVGTRKAQAISKVCFAAVAHMSANRVDELRVALGSVAPIPIRCVNTEKVTLGKAIDQNAIDVARAELAREITPITDIRSTKDYRMRVSQNLLEDFLRNLK
jgi:CO/xanthine dehydrogenase FAD-binding subunit